MRPRKPWEGACGPLGAITIVKPHRALAFSTAQALAFSGAVHILVIAAICGGIIVVLTPVVRAVGDAAVEAVDKAVEAVDKVAEDIKKIP